MTFLPKGTTIPKGESKYMKFIEPENKFRVLGDAITGFELWVEGKPVRRKSKAEFTPEQLAKADINKFNGLKKLPQYFWVFPVWNYQTGQVEILEITQVTVMNGINDFLEDNDYGNDPKGYDLVVVRDDTKEKVEYRVKAKPPKEMDEDVKKASKDLSINLEALFTGEDPFKEALEAEAQKVVDEIPF
jgi:hypothetical protein